MATRKPTTYIYKYGSVSTPRLPQPTRLKQKKLDGKREKWLCYSCDSKYTKGHKCVEKKLFYVDCEEEEENEQETSREEDVHQEPTLEEEEMSLTILCNALGGITTPKTLKIEGHINNKKVIVFINSCSTHNFIHCKVAKELNYFLYPAP